MYVSLATIREWRIKRDHDWAQLAQSERRGPPPARLDMAASRTWSAWVAPPRVRSRAARSGRAPRPTCARASASRNGGTKHRRDDEDAATIEAQREATRAAVESAWREGGAMSSYSKDDVHRAVLGTIAVARHYERLIEQQKYTFAKYGEGAVLPDDHGDPVWVASRLRMVSVMTGVEPRAVPDMVQAGGAGILSLSANSIMRTVLELKALVPNGDVAHAIALEPDVLLVGARDAMTVRRGGRDAMAFLRAIPMPEPCVRLLICEEPGLILGKGGIERLEQIRETADEHGENMRATCAALDDDGWLDVNAQRWFTNVFCGYY